MLEGVGHETTRARDETQPTCGLFLLLGPLALGFTVSRGAQGAAAFHLAMPVKGWAAGTTDEHECGKAMEGEDWQAGGGKAHWSQLPRILTPTLDTGSQALERPAVPSAPVISTKQLSLSSP